jgi:hypothetical protein
MAQRKAEITQGQIAPGIELSVVLRRCRWPDEVRASVADDTVAQSSHGRGNEGAHRNTGGQAAITLPIGRCWRMGHPSPGGSLQWVTAQTRLYPRIAPQSAPHFCAWRSWSRRRARAMTRRPADAAGTLRLPGDAKGCKGRRAPSRPARRFGLPWQFRFAFV